MKLWIEFFILILAANLLPMLTIGGHKMESTFTDLMLTYILYECLKMKHSRRKND